MNSIRESEGTKVQEWYQGTVRAEESKDANKEPEIAW